MLEYILFALPSYLIARPKEYLRSALGYCIGVVASYAMILTAITAAHWPEGEIENHVAQMFLLPLVGVGLAWFTKEAQGNTTVDASSMRVRFGMFVGWLFNAAALLLGGLAAVITINQAGPLSQGQTYAITALIGVAGAVWLLGRGIRYVLVGPPQAPQPTPLVDTRQHERTSVASAVPFSTPMVSPAAPVSTIAVSSVVMPSSTSTEPSTTAAQIDASEAALLSREWIAQHAKTLGLIICVLVVALVAHFWQQ